VESYAYDLFAQPFEFYDVGREDGTPVSLDELQVTSDHVKGIGVENEEHSLFLGDVEGNLCTNLHVFLSTEPRSDDEYMQTRKQSGELRAQRLCRPAWAPLSEISESEHAPSRNDVRLFAENWVNDEIGRVGFDGVCGRRGTDYMREIHSLNVRAAK
jgi:hypothetical protein